MSYCRFSSDNFKCDVYVYEDISGGYTIHIATSKIIGNAPELPNITKVSSNEYFKAYKAQMKFMDTVKRKKIGLPQDGKTFNVATTKECADKLLELKAIGYSVPQYAIDSLIEEEE